MCSAAFTSDRRDMKDTYINFQCNATVGVVTVILLLIIIISYILEKHKFKVYMRPMKLGSEMCIFIECCMLAHVVVRVLVQQRALELFCSQAILE